MKNLERLSYKKFELCKVLGISERKLHELTKGDNPPPHAKLGGVTLYPRDLVVRCLEELVVSQAKEDKKSDD